MEMDVEDLVTDRCEWAEVSSDFIISDAVFACGEVTRFRNLVIWLTF